MSTDTVVAVGVDACPAGWVATVLGEKSTTIETHKEFSEITGSYSGAHQILVDVPIGLPDKMRRACDEEARELLGCRQSSVFFPPCTAAVDLKDYEDANDAQQEHIGHGLSQQAHNISPKIREVRDVVGDHYDGVVRESHPELCFAALNGQPIAYPKSSPRGRGQRMHLLSEVLENAVNLYENTREEYLLKQVRRDDILDSMVLAVAARESSLDTVPSEPVSDDPRIYYPGFETPSISVE
ncbi:DUF429 domain-containing protein [Halapricum salinum]|uniref:DUF429 domain-containing protein n=1 Tax=Halapricum salinum TaxID=1457250 RepID=UPI001376468F|nr:DUF429 domain-containing protein [Halapricum salinum]